MTTKPELPTPPAAKTLAEQKADFTAEGAPPPGVAGTPVPASIHISHDGKHVPPDHVPQGSKVAAGTSATAKK